MAMNMDLEIKKSMNRLFRIVVDTVEHEVNSLGYEYWRPNMPLDYIEAFLNEVKDHLLPDLVKYYEDQIAKIQALNNAGGTD